LKRYILCFRSEHSPINKSINQVWTHITQVHNVLSCFLVVDTAPFTFAEICATHTSPAALAVLGAGLDTPTLEEDGAGFAAVLECSPERQPPTTADLVPAPVLEVRDVHMD